jgi:hypothetical protein
MIRKLTALLLLWSFAANAGLPPTTIQGQSDASPKTKFSFQVPYNQFTDLGGIKGLIETGNANVLSNASFEATGITTSSVPAWTLGTNVTAAANTSSYKDGKQAVTLSTNVTGVTGAQVLFYQSLTPGSYDANVNKIARLWVNTSITTLQVCAYLASGTVNCQAVPSSSTWQPVTSNFIMPSSGTIGVALYTTAAIAASTVIGSVDKAQVSDADNLSQVAQPFTVGTAMLPINNSNCNYAVTNTTSWTSMTAAGCPGIVTNGSVTASSTTAQITIPSQGPGYYRVAFTGLLRISGAGAQACNFRYTDGTNFSADTTAGSATAGLSPSGSFWSQKYDSPSSTITFTLQARQQTASATGFCQIVTTDDTSGNGGQWEVIYTPSQSQTAAFANQQWQPTVTKLLSGSGTYTAPNGVSRIEVEMVGGGGGGAGASANNGSAGGATTFGTSLLVANGGAGGTAGAGNGGLGGTVSVSAPAIQLVAIQGSQGGEGSTSTAGYGAQGGTSPFGGSSSGNGGNAAANSGSGGGGGASATNGGAGGGAGGYIKAQINFPAASYSYSVGTGGAGGAAGGSAGGNGGSGAIIITEYYFAGNMPQFMGSVTSNTSGQVRTEFGTISINGTSSALVSGSSGFMAYSSSAAANRVTVTFSPAFTAKPTCTSTTEYGGDTTTSYGMRWVSLSATGGELISMTGANSSAASNIYYANVICMSPR